MNFKEVLKKLGLTDEQIKSVETEMKSEKIYLSSNENIDTRYDKLKAKKESIEEELKVANETITTLKESNADVEGLQTKISDYETQIATLKESNANVIRKMAIDNALNSQLSDCKHAELIKGQYKLDDIKVNENGEIENLELLSLQTEKFKTGEYKDFWTPTLTGTTPSNNGEGQAKVTKEEFAKMGYRERVQLYQEQPSLYKELSE